MAEVGTKNPEIRDPGVSLPVEHRGDETTHILFVDDDPQVLSSLRRLLSVHRVSCQFEGMTSAQEALNRIRQGGLDLIVSDIKMPGMDGIEMLARLKGDECLRNVPIIMLTGDDDANTRNVALQLGAVEFLSKPVDPDEFAARVSNVLATKAYQRHLEAQNRLLEEQISQIQRLENIGFMAAGIVHDSKNMVATIVGKAELCLRADSPERRETLLNQIIASSQQSVKYLEQILELGRSEKATASIVCLNRAIDDIFQMLSSTKPPDVRLTKVLRSEPLCVQISTQDLGHIILNLCINAFQAMGNRGEVKIMAEECNLGDAQIAGRRQVVPGRFVKLEICDNGPGIPAEIHDKVFETFFTTKKHAGGTGLGLSVVKRLVSHHHGFMELESEPASGTCFRIYLPRAES